MAQKPQHDIICNMTEHAHISNQEVKKSENPNLLYIFSHSWKHTLSSSEGYDWDNGGNKREKIQKQAASSLWYLRGYPNYLGYPDSRNYHLRELIGDFPTDPKVIKQIVLPGLQGTQDDFYAFSRMALDEDHGGQISTVVKIPKTNDFVKKSILTDVVSAAGAKILTSAMTEPHYVKINEELSKRAGISSEEYKKFKIAKLNFDLFTIGYLMSYMKEGSEDAKYIDQNILEFEDNKPIKHLKENLDLTLNLI